MVTWLEILKAVGRERLSIKCEGHETKAKEMTPIIHNKSKQRNEAIVDQSKYMWQELRIRKNACDQGFGFSSRRVRKWHELSNQSHTVASKTKANANYFPHKQAKGINWVKRIQSERKIGEEKKTTTKKGKKARVNAGTRIRTWVTAATTQGPNH